MAKNENLTERLEGALTALESERAAHAATKAELETAQNDLRAAGQNITKLDGDISALREQVEKLTADNTAATDRAALLEKEKAEAVARAEKAEKRLALDPAHITVAGRQEPVADASNGTGDSATLLEQFEAITDPLEKRKFWRAHAKALESLTNQPKEK